MYYMKNVVLIGMPGAGKSTVGVILAKVLGFHFIDSDLLIQEQEKCLLKDIIEKDGLEGLIAVEEQVNAGIITGLLIMFAALVGGWGLATPMRLIAETSLDLAVSLDAGSNYDPAVMGGAAPVAAGILIHLLTATALGTVFPFLASGSPTEELALWGFVYGAMIWFLAQFLMLPLVNPVMWSVMPPLLLLAYHLVYGALLGVFPARRRPD
jgi:hypothetical protein